MKKNKINLNEKDLEKISGGQSLASQECSKVPVRGPDGLRAMLVRYAAPEPPHRKPLPTGVDKDITKNPEDTLSKITGDISSKSEK